MDRDAMILSLADRVTWNIKLTGVRPELVEDLTNEAWLGAIRAVDKYDSRKGCGLPTYADYRIRGAIQDAFRRWDKLSREQRLDIQSGRELAPIFVGVECVRVVCPANVDRSIGELDVATLLSRAELTPKEQCVMKMCFIGGLKRTEVAKSIGVSNGRISQVVRSGIAKLQGVVSPR